jgi:hypothetical protein
LTIFLAVHPFQGRRYQKEGEMVKGARGEGPWKEGLSPKRFLKKRLDIGHELIYISCVSRFENSKETP